MKLLRVHLKDYADERLYPTKRLLSKEDPDWEETPREGQVRHGPYELYADYEKQVVRVNQDEVPFSLVGFMRPVHLNALENAAADEIQGDLDAPSKDFTCPECDVGFYTKQALGGHRRHCKGRVQ